MKVRESKNVTKFRIIDSYTSRQVEILERDEAIKKYGDLDIDSGYTEGFYKGGFETSVWLDIPGMKLCGRGNERINIRWQPNTEATFRGKRTGLLITVTKYGADDYSAWWHDKDATETDGYSVRGTMRQIMNEMKGEY